MSSNRSVSFISMAYPGDTFFVVSYRADEGINQLFLIDMLLASKSSDIDFSDVLESPASFVMRTPEEAFPLHGVVSSFEQLHRSHELSFYRAVLSPSLWLLTLHESSQVFLDKTVPQILELVLQDAGLSSQDYRFKLQHDYPVRELVCQYNESHFHFFMRWLEREGMYFYFERNDDRSVVVVTDTVIAHPDLRRHKEVRYAPPQGLQDGDDEEVLYSLICRQQPTRRHVQLKDHNYQTPGLDITAMHTVNELGGGGSYEYGDHILNPTEARRLALVRAEANKAAAIRFHGESSLRAIRGGYVFTLAHHFRADYNRDYLVVSCQHRGNQASYLDAGLHKELEGLVEEGPAYENSFTAIPSDVQFRPLRTLGKPRISGTLTATIDAAGTGQYAELDDQGRYKVILPYDLSGRKDGHASCWVRMMQPYGGADHGLHMPLHKGTEVLLTFEAGDSDRPVIAGAVPNPQQPSVVSSADQTMCKLTTSGKNKVHIEDKEGEQRILMSTPTQNTWLRMGAPNDPPASATDPKSDEGKDKEPFTSGFRINTTGNYYGNIEANYNLKVGGSSLSVVVGNVGSVNLGASSTLVVGLKDFIVLAASFDMFVGARLGLNVGATYDINITKHGSYAPDFTKTAAEKIDVVAMHNKVTENESKLTLTTNELGETKDQLYEVVNMMAEEQTQLVETKQQIIESLTQMCEENVAMFQSEMKMIDSKTEMLSSKISIADEDTKVLNSKMEVMSDYISVLDSMIFV